jgi:sec-independent protein translocase protein TatC
MAKSKPSEMPFLDHLEELRWRLVWSFAALGIGVGIGFFLSVHYDMIALLASPIAPYLVDHKLRYTHPVDTFSITIQIAMVIGGVIAAPVILYQIWAFLAPALHRREKRVVIPVIVSAVTLFAMGVALAFFFVLPMSFKFLLNFQSESMEPMITASDYFGFISTLCLIFGATFELPLAIAALTLLGIVTPQFLSKYRRHAIVACWAVAAIITPGDFLGTTLALAIPMYLLYEVSVIISYTIYRRRERRLAEMVGAEPAT